MRGVYVEATMRSDVVIPAAPALDLIGGKARIPPPTLGRDRGPMKIERQCKLPFWIA